MRVVERFALRGESEGVAAPLAGRVGYDFRFPEIGVSPPVLRGAVDPVVGPSRWGLRNRAYRRSGSTTFFRLRYRALALANGVTIGDSRARTLMQVVARVGDFGFPACSTGPANVATSVSGTGETLSGFMTVNPACGRPCRGSVAIDHCGANANH